MRNEDISLIEVLRKLRDCESRVLPPSLVWQEVERLFLRAAAERDEALDWVDRLETALRQTQRIVDGACAPTSVSKESLLHVPDDVAMRRHLSRAERDAAIARAEAAEAQVQALMTKVDALCSKGQCGCSWDHEGDVFEYHSPKLVAALAQVERLREAAAPFVTHYKPWMDEYPDADRCWTYPIMNMGTVRKLRAALATKEPADG